MKKYRAGRLNWKKLDPILEERRKQGVTFREISQELGVSIGRLSNRAMELGICWLHRSKITDENIKEMKKLFLEGLSIESIALVTNRSPSYVNKLLRLEGILNKYKYSRKTKQWYKVEQGLRVFPNLKR